MNSVLPGLRGGYARWNILSITNLWSLDANDLLVWRNPSQVHGFGLMLVQICTLWVLWHLWRFHSIFLSRSLLRLTNFWIRILTDLIFNFLTITIVIDSHPGFVFVEFVLLTHIIIDLFGLQFDLTEHIDGLIINLRLLDCWQVAKHSRGTNSSLFLLILLCNFIVRFLDLAIDLKMLHCWSVNSLTIWSL